MRRTLVVSWIAAGAAVLAPNWAWAVFGVGDTSFVTVIANPAEAANWANEIRNLEAQVTALRATLQEIQQVRTYAGDPRLAVQTPTGVPALLLDGEALLHQASTVSAVRDLSPVKADDPALAQLVARLSGGLDAPGMMSVEGAPVPRDLSRYISAATAANTAQAISSQISGEQDIRRRTADDLGAAWSAFQQASTESQKQSALTRIAALEALERSSEGRRNAELADLSLSDRQDRAQATIAAVASDEQAQAQISSLQSQASGRSAAADAAARSIVAEAPDAPAARDYSGLKTWLPSDRTPVGP